MKRYLCPFPGCLAFVDTMGRYCSKHSSLQAEKDARHAEWTAKRWEQHHERIDYAWVWHDARWRKTRAERLRMEPECRRCGEKATHVDHIVPHRGDESLAFDIENTQSLCARCSNVKSREDRG